ncbi:MAG: DNA repair protein RadC [Gemmatimonadetes bacterium]|nr:DNA repair protein RadC [Gemmatimonadota bacterium]
MSGDLAIPRLARDGKLVAMTPYLLAETQERPRERLFTLGPSALTAVELVAILLGTGTRRSDVLEVAADLLEAAGGTLRDIARKPAAALARVPGVGRVKAARVAAALEMARRLDGQRRESGTEMRSAEDVHRRCGPMLRDLVVEEFHLLTLDARNRVTRQTLVTKGILNSSLVHPREVFRAAIAEAAAGIIVVHNHPSGNPGPSAEDRAVTTQLVEAGKLLDMPVYDHVIVGGDRFFSFAEAGLL